MSTLTKSKKLARPLAVRRAPAVAKKFAPGYARSVLKIKEGVDLTKPTLPPGKYL